MTNKKDPYASEAETKALLVPDTRTAAELKLAQMMTVRGADEQGAEAYPILWKIAVELLVEQPAQHPVQRFDHTAAANAALRDAQNRSTEIAKTLQKRPQNCGTGYCSCIECVMK